MPVKFWHIEAKVPLHETLQSVNKDTKERRAQWTSLLYPLMASEGLAEAISCLDCCTVFAVHGLQAGQEAAPNTNATEHCPQHIPRHSVKGFAEIHKTAVELSPFTAVLVLQSMEDIVLITGALVRAKPRLAGSSEAMLFCPCSKSAL